MPVPLGSLAKIAWAKETSFGTRASTISASLPFISESIKATIEPARVEAIQASRSRLLDYEPPARMSVSGDIELPFFVTSVSTSSSSDPFVILMQSCMGLVTIDTTNNKITWGLGDTLPSLSFFVDRNTSNASNTRNYFYYSGVKVNQFTITGEENGIVRLRVSVHGQKEELSTTAQAITTSNLPVAKFWFSNVTLDDGTAANVKVRSFEITVNNNLITDRYFNNLLDLGSSYSDTSPNQMVAVLTDLPEGRREITGRLELWFDSTRWYEKFLSASSVSLKIDVAASYIKSGVFKTTISLPNIVVTGETPNVNGPNPLNFTMNFTAYQKAASNDELSIVVSKVA
jgi:hypothetical protein